MALVMIMGAGTIYLHFVPAWPVAYSTCWRHGLPDVATLQFIPRLNVFLFRIY